MTIPNEKDQQDYLKKQKAIDDNYVKPPSFLQMIKNFKEHAVNFINNPNLVEPDVYTARLATCNDCEHLIKKSLRCGACGCMLEAKARMKTAYCPKGKWENGSPKKNGEE